MHCVVFRPIAILVFVVIFMVAVAIVTSFIAPVAADNRTLQVGAAFWSQHQTISDRAWQAQRKALQADYKAKHRAAAKHKDVNVTTVVYKSQQTLT